MNYKVKELADVAGISVRTLHYYDEIGLLKPTEVNDSGYRFYSEDDLEKLQQILFFKELDFSLNEIKDILDNPSFDREQALKSHKELLIKKKNRIDKIIESIELTLKSEEGGREMSKRKMFDAFDMSDIEEHKKKYAEEVRQKYPKEIVEESERKTANYNKSDWSRIQGQLEDFYITIISLMDKGPEASEVQEIIGQYRQYITDNFYNCTLEIFRGLGDLYVSDERFTQNIDAYKPGLAQFLRDAMHIYCDNMEK